MISVLLPTRKRPHNLRLSVESLLTAHDPKTVEVLLRIDDDDKSLPQLDDVAARFARFEVTTGPRLGYARMHDYYTELANAAKGHWLFVWNDDTQMLTAGWDAMLHECPDYAVQFIRRDCTNTSDFTFPIVGRGVYNAMGMMADNGFADAWLSDVACFAGVSVIRDDIVFHHDRLQDETSGDNGSVGPPEWNRFNSDVSRQRRREAMQRIMDDPHWKDRFSGWDIEERDCNVDYINLARGTARAYSAVLKGRK